MHGETNCHWFEGYTFLGTTPQKLPHFMYALWSNKKESTFSNSHRISHLPLQTMLASTERHCVQEHRKMRFTPSTLIMLLYKSAFPIKIFISLNTLKPNGLTDVWCIMIRKEAWPSCSQGPEVD